MRGYDWGQGREWWPRARIGLGLTFVLIIAATVYLQTMLPGMGYSGDAAKFQYVGKILGIPHAPGYPLYVLLSRLFILIPLKSIAFRVNLMSVVFSLLTLIFIFLILTRLSATLWVAIGATLSFAFTMTYWTQSLVAEVYTLNSLFFSAVILLLVEWQRTGKERFFHLALLVLGLSLAHHLTMALVVPGTILFALMVRPKQLFSPKTWGVAAGGIAAALIPYSYLYLRTMQQAPYVEAPVRNLGDLFKVLTARRFQAELFSFSFQDVLQQRIPWFFQQIEKEWSWPLILIALVGLAWMTRANFPLTVFLALVIACQATFIVNYDIPDIAVFLIPVYSVLALFLGMGWQTLILKLPEWPFSNLSSLPRKIIQIIGTLLCLGGALGMMAGNFSRVSLKSLISYDERMTAVFEALKLDRFSIIITDNYHDSQFVNYKMFAEYPDRPVLHFDLDPAEDILVQIKRKIGREIRTNRRLQCFLFPDRNDDRLPASLVEAFWKEQGRALREKLFESVYLVSPLTRQWFSSQGLRTTKIIGREKRKGRLYSFYRAFLPLDF